MSIRENTYGITWGTYAMTTNEGMGAPTGWRRPISGAKIALTAHRKRHPHIRYLNDARLLLTAYRAGV